MEFRTTGSRDERRRRALIDEAQAEPAPVEETPPVKRKSKSDDGASRYSLASLAEGLPRITHLLPKRRLTLWLWLLGAAALIAGLTALDAYHAVWRTRFPSVDWSMLDAEAPGSLARWFASLVFVWAAFASFQVYLIRLHRADDYRGGYRLWSWAAAVFLFASADAGASLHVLAGSALAAASGTPHHSQLAGLLLVATVAIGFGLRMVWEIKPSRGALAVLATAAVCYVFTSLAGSGAIGPSSMAPWAGGAAALAGHALVLLTVGVFGRYVYLEAHGGIAKRPKKAKGSEGASKKRGTKSDSVNGLRAEAKKRPAKTDLDGVKSESGAGAGKPSTEPMKKPVETKPAAPSLATKPVAKPSAADDEEDEDDAGADSSRLSKAERRRLRKQQRQKAA